jgi:hypothetical protein
MEKQLAITVSSIKTFTGMEGSGYNAILHLDGKKVAQVIDDATGGPLMLNWLDDGKSTLMISFRDYQDEEKLVERGTRSPAEKKIMDHLLTMPKYEAWKDHFTYPSIETFVDDIVNEAMLEKSFLSSARRYMKKVVGLRPDGAIMLFKLKPGMLETMNEAAKQGLRTRFPTYKFFFDMTEAEAVAAVKKAHKS